MIEQRWGSSWEFLSGLLLFLADKNAAVSFGLGDFQVKLEVFVDVGISILNGPRVFE